MTVPPERDGEAGLTLVELLVTLAVTAVVVAIVSGSAVLVLRTVSRTDLRMQDLGEARTGMDVLGKDLRTAVPQSTNGTPFIAAGAARVLFYARLDTGPADLPKKVELVLADGVLTERVWEPGVAGSYGGPPRARVLARNVANSDIFAYTDRAGVVLDPVTQLQAVRGVQVTLEVAKPTALGTPPTELRSWVRLPNVLGPEAVAGAGS